jgi:hypothetical protein
MTLGQTMLSNHIPRIALPKRANSRKNEGKKKFKN